MKSDYINKLDGKAERRYVTPNIEVREEGEDNNVVEGIAAVVNSETDLGWYTERIAPGAFDDALNDDVVALFNHDPNLPLARTTATGDAKLELFLTDSGDLGYRFNVPNTTMGRDLKENIRSGVVAKSSFAFTVLEEDWIESKDKEVGDIREIKKVKRLYDVSPVTYPAYNDTSVAARSLERSQEPTKELMQDKYDMDKDIQNLELK